MGKEKLPMRNSQIRIEKAKPNDKVFPEGFIEELDLKDQVELVKLYQDFGTLGVRKWIGEWNKKQGHMIVLLMKAMIEDIQGNKDDN
jgi:hypothetical protein